MFLFVFGFLIISSSFRASESASLKQKEDNTLEMFKKDISTVGGAMENLTFDLLKTVLEEENEDYSAEITSTTQKSEDPTTLAPENNTATSLNRKTRSVQDEDLLTICQKRYCPQIRQEHSENYKELKSEVKKMQELIQLLGIQQKVIKMQSREEPQNHDANHELAAIKNSILEAVKTLNHTRELILLQRQKTTEMEDEIRLQHVELNRLKKTVRDILRSNGTVLEEVVGIAEEEPSNLTHTSARASEFSELKKLLKTLPDDEEPENDIQNTVLDLEKRLKKKRRQETLEKELKSLQKLMDGGREETEEESLLKQLQKALKSPSVESKSDNVEINNLQDLQEAISRLRPKENSDLELQQFQSMLNKLVNNNNNPSSNFRPSGSGITLTPQQLNEIRNKLSSSPGLNPFPVQQSPWFPNYSPPVYRPPQTPLYPAEVPSSPQFFPAPQYPQTPYTPQPNYNVAAPEKPQSYPEVQPSGKYQEDLRTQIDGLQAAINNLNYPDYAQKPEDKAVLDDLEHQIGELRGIVSNLNQNYEQHNSEYNRKKRSAEDNKVADDESTRIVDQVTNLLGNFVEKDAGKRMGVEEIQEQIASLKNQYKQF